jgi:inhibitor of cysteine peptidase
MKGKEFTILTLLIGITTIAALSVDVKYSKADLIKFGSYEELKDFLQYKRPSTHDIFPYSMSLKSLNSANLYVMGESDYSRTNVQVEGVDEADIVKTDGEYIYVISGQKVVTVRAYPAEKAAVLSRIPVNGTLKQLFINAERLIIFYESSSGNEAKTLVNIYDISNREHPELKSEIAVDGRYFSSRMIGDYVYTIVREDASLVGDEVSLPRIYFANKCRNIPATDVYYSDIADYGYTFTTIASVNVFEDVQEPNSKTILSGWATNIYVSLENTYIAIRDEDQTVLHRIRTEDGEISVAANGEVPGYVLNQFSMDEYEGYFRVATTSQMTNLGENPSQRLLNLQNNVYVLNMDLGIICKLEGIAPREKIHSVRFIGGICYLVTFRKVDPLFVIALSDAHEPQILGELEITGYSDYLHPYDESHMIGVGKETIAAEQGDFSWYQGVKISFFDVADVTKPKELAKYEIGDRGTDSPVLSDHKAFLFDKEKNLLVVPVSVAYINKSQYPNGVPPYTYGNVVWQGAYVFTVSLTTEEKITLKGTITHVENCDVDNSSYHVTRALYIGNVLYTVSESEIKMNSLTDLSEINELDLNK